MWQVSDKLEAVKGQFFVLHGIETSTLLEDIDLLANSSPCLEGAGLRVSIANSLARWVTYPFSRGSLENVHAF